MDFAPSDEQTAIYDMAYAFGQEAIAPNAYAWEQDASIPRAVLEQAAALGFGGMFIAEEYGGIGLSRLDGTFVFEALSAACPSVAAFISIHNLCASMIAAHGTEAFRDAHMSDIIAMKKIGSYCLTEPGSGSDAAALKTKAVRTNDGYALSGTKAFISGGGYSDFYVVMSRTGSDGPKGISAIVVEDGAKGLSFGAPERKMGWRAQPTAQVQLDAAQADAINLLGEEGEGFTYAMAGLDGGRLNISACALGAAQAALDAALAYMGERQAFGRKLQQFQALQFRIADMEIELQAARVFLRQAAWKLDTGAPDATKHCAMAKRFVTDTAFKVANDALQIFGGYGYLEDYGVEKIVRDIRVHQILEGTNEIMRLIPVRALLGERAA